MLMRPISLRRYARMVKRAGRLLAGHDVLYRYDFHPRKRIFGTTYGGWTVAPDHLDRRGIMLSFGVGTDISFDREMIRNFGMIVHGFDPSPHVSTWVSEQLALSSYIFHPFGIAEVDGCSTFYSPEKTTGMYSLRKEHSNVTSVAVELPVFTLHTIINSLQVPSIEVLKMDVEGAEYGLIPSIVKCPVPIKQLLIEFHHRIGVASLKTTIEAVNRLRAAGFLLFHVSETSSEFSFIHRQAVRS